MTGPHLVQASQKKESKITNIWPSGSKEPLVNKGAVMERQKFRRTKGANQFSGHMER